MRHISSRLALCGLAAFLGAVWAAPVQSAPKSKTAKMAVKARSKFKKTSGVRVLPGGLRVQDLKVGRGALATSGKTVKVHYIGTLTNGTKFDASYDRGEPFSFSLGGGQVIKGWDQGVKGMRVGGKRKLTIPPTMGYGARGAGGVIPPNATLVFEVELLKIN